MICVCVCNPVNPKIGGNKYNRHLVKLLCMGFCNGLVNRYNRHLIKILCMGFCNGLVNRYNRHFGNSDSDKKF
jgi:hypothetical protein